MITQFLSMSYCTHTAAPRVTLSQERHPEARKGAEESDKAGSLTKEFTI